MPAHNTAQKERKSTGPQEKAGGKTMGKRDKRATACNWENIEEYLSLLKQRVVVNGLTVAICLRAMGAGRFEVKYMNGITDNLPIAGSIKVKNARKTHVEACMSIGDVVLVNGGQITGTMTAGHMARAERYLRTIQEQGCWSEGPAQIPSEFASRIDTEARISFPVSFFGAVVHDDEEAWEFDRDEEEAASGIARPRVKAKVAEAEAEPEINMDDL
jgi:hypothetical protein